MKHVFFAKFSLPIHYVQARYPNHVLSGQMMAGQQDGTNRER